MPVGPLGDPLKSLREGIEDGSVKVWCYCYDSPQPSGPWVPPDDWHADVCCVDHSSADSS